MTRRAAGVASLPVSRSMSTKAMPSGASNGTLARPASARFMNCGPDRQRRLRAAQADRLVVVEADPDDRQQLRREADEPGVAQVVGRAGLAGGVEREPGRARAGAGAFVEHAAHHVGDEEGRVRPRDASAAAAVRASCTSLPPLRRCAAMCCSGRIDAAVREHRVGGGDLERRRLEHAERDRRIRLAAACRRRAASRAPRRCRSRPSRRLESSRGCASARARGGT